MSENLGPDRPLPCSSEFPSAEAYVSSLLDLVGTNALLRTLCGGVHILDFFTSSPSLYDRVLPSEWREWFTNIETKDLLDLLLVEDLSQFNDSDSPQWRHAPRPPDSLLSYIRTIQKHLLIRSPLQSQCARNRAMQPAHKLARHVAVGMNVKKVHEVGIFASYISSLATDIANASDGADITHLVDFGSGQNYLGRALACEPYNKDIVAIESKQANAARAKELDVMAKLAVKQKLARNKKAFRLGLEGPGTGVVPQPVSSVNASDEINADSASSGSKSATELEDAITGGTGKIQYVEHRISDGDLSDVISRMPSSEAPKNLMVMSLHSCGNLVHHGLRSLILNDEVKAVAMVGCCYNLVTERLGPATYKLPELRPTTHAHPRLHATGEACDPHGFPMSERLCGYYSPSSEESGDSQKEKGVRLNITARMMAVQAPANWGSEGTSAFFTRHYYRALLQRIFLDRGVVGPPSAECVGGSVTSSSPSSQPKEGAIEGTISPLGHTSSGGTPIIIGSLRKAYYADFVSYVRGALGKLTAPGENHPHAEVFRKKCGDITDEEIRRYDAEYVARRKELSMIWSLMAFSAGVIEATIVVDRWLWLKEQKEISTAWVEPVFEYSLSPRNLVLVGVKKANIE